MGDVDSAIQKLNTDFAKAPSKMKRDAPPVVSRHLPSNEFQAITKDVVEISRLAAWSTVSIPNTRLLRGNTIQLL